jgi:hypothetical protein
MDGWQRARLIPTSGMSGQDEQEARATSSLLAVLTAVKEFGNGLVRELGGVTGTIETFIEIPFVLADGRSVRPDGLIRATRGAKTWVCLVEVKTGNSPLSREQVESYLDLAREQKFDALVTISNDLAPAPGVHPVELDRRKTKSVELHHRSWAELLSLAMVHHVHTGVSDPDEAWVLGELIRYLAHPKSGALDFQDMGSSWVPVREAIAAGTLRPTDKGIAEVALRWEQLVRFSALRLERELGSGVQVVLSRKEQSDPRLRQQTIRAGLAQNGSMSGTIRIPGTVGDLDIEADLRTGRVTVSVDVPAPLEGRPVTRVNWIVRQLQEAPESARIDSFAHMARTSMSELLKTVRLDPNVLVVDPKADIRRFRVSATSQLGTKRGVGRGSFIDSILSAVDGIYGSVLQSIRPWTAKPPQLPKPGSAVDTAVVELRLSPTEVDEMESEGFAPQSETSPLAVPIDWASLPVPSVDHRVEMDPPMVSWDDQLDDLAEERQLTPLTSE